MQPSFLSVLRGFGRSYKKFRENYNLRSVKVEDSMYVTHCSPHIPSNDNKVVICIPGGANWDYAGGVFHASIITNKLHCQDLFVVNRIGYVDMFNQRSVKHVVSCIDKINSLPEAQGKQLILVGVSIGGLVLAQYLAYGYDQCHQYISLCSSIDVDDFYKGIHELYWLRYYMKVMQKTMRNDKCHVWDVDRLLPYMKFLRLYERLLKRDLTNFTIIYSDYDPVSQNIEHHCKGLNIRQLIEAKNATHCCEQACAQLAAVIQKL